jgi:hypothetical protein
MIITPVETGHKIQLPAEWAMEFGFKKNVALEKTVAGILVRPCETVSWDEVFAKKLSMGQNVFALDLSEMRGDDFLF